MLSRLRQEYGRKLCTFEDKDYYSFPSIHSLATTTEKKLRSLGLGYRAKYVLETAKMLNERGGENWLAELRTKPYAEVQEKLVAFHGIGRKVADCIALFSLDKLEAIPVDTHVWQIACRDYKADLPALEKKTLTKAIYTQIGDFFRSRFGLQAGWAHSVLFTLELPLFKALLPSHLQLSTASQKTKKKKTGALEKNEADTNSSSKKSSNLKRKATNSTNQRKQKGLRKKQKRKSREQPQRSKE